MYVLLSDPTELFTHKHYYIMLIGFFIKLPKLISEVFWCGMYTKDEKSLSSTSEFF